MKEKEQRDRELAIKRHLNGEGVSAIAKSLGYSRRWIYKWIKRYEAGAEDRGWYDDQTKRRHSNPRQLSGEIVDAVKLVRLALDNQRLFSGAQAISWELEELGVSPVPSLRTINRILGREGLTHRRTGRYEPKGKKYPKLCGERANEVHQMDFVGPCYLTGPVRFYSLNSVDVATGRCAVTPVLSKAGQQTIDAIWANWRRLGIPEHQQVDNEAVFYGSRRYPRGMGNLIRLCLTHDVEPWFIPVAEPWRNGVVEKFNDHYRDRFLTKVTMRDEQELTRESLAFEQKHNSRYRYSKLKGKTPQAAFEQTERKIRFPETDTAPRHPMAKPETGSYHLVRFIRSDAVLDVFGEKFELPSQAVYEYVVATIDAGQQRLKVRLNEVTIEEYRYTTTCLSADME